MAAKTEGAQTVKRDYFKEVTDRVIADLERGCVPWAFDDFDVSGALIMPINGVTGRLYRGMNSLSLMGYARAMSGAQYDPRFVTYKQIKANGWKLKPDEWEKRLPVYFYKQIQVDVPPAVLQAQHEKMKRKAIEAGESGDVEMPPSKRTVWLLRSYGVFHASQVEGMPALTIKKPSWDVNQSVQTMLDGMIGAGMDFQAGGPAASYSPKRDALAMPCSSTFVSPESHSAVLLHELGHATGHESRLSRTELYVSRADKAAYAREELVAELTSAMACATLGIGYDTSRHSAYVEHFLNALKKDKKLLMVAAGRAALATDYLVDLVPGLRPEIEAQRLAAISAGCGEVSSDAVAAQEEEFDVAGLVVDAAPEEFDVEALFNEFEESALDDEIEAHVLGSRSQETCSLGM